MRYLAAMLMLGLLTGCGEAMPTSSPGGAAPATDYFAEAEGWTRGVKPAAPDALAVAQAAPGGPPQAAGEAVPPAQAHARKIIYRADVDLVVEEFEGLPEKIEGLVKEFGGYISRSNLHGTSGTPRGGDWTCRIPADKYEPFLEAARGLGEVRSVTSDSDDVSAEFYDIEARIRNKKVEETRLLKHLEDSTGKLEDILAVEREIARVRGEIEQMEGRLRVLADLTSLTTIVIRVAEIKDYVPEAAPTYATRVRRSFASSLDSLVAFGQNLSILAVALVPWLPLILVPVIALYYLGRFIGRRLRGPRAGTPFKAA
jgi:hypothetical protein